MILLSAWKCIPGRLHGFAGKEFLMFVMFCKSLLLTIASSSSVVKKKILEIYWLFNPGIISEMMLRKLCCPPAKSGSDSTFNKNDLLYPLFFAPMTQLSHERTIFQKAFLLITQVFFGFFWFFQHSVVYSTTQIKVRNFSSWFGSICSTGEI